MQFPGHVGAALVAYSPVWLIAAVLGRSRLALVGAAVTVALASLPDVDLYGSRMNHRGYLHTVWFAVVAGGGCAVAFAAGGGHLAALSTAGLGAFGFVVGTTAVLTHVAADSLTPMGVAPFAPVSRRRYSFGVTRSADPVANRRLLLLGLGTTVATVALGSVLSTPAW